MSHRQHPRFDELFDRAADRGMRIGLLAGDPHGPEGAKRCDIAGITVSRFDAPHSALWHAPATLDTLDAAADRALDALALL